MKIIGEAGGTKIDWRVLDGGEPQAILTSGYNATLSEKPTFCAELLRHIGDPSAITSIHFYAAGIRGEETSSVVEDHFSEHFSEAQIEVASDTLAAARGLLGHDGGWIGFIGTGSGLARYNGHQIIEQVPSLGYVLGDEGSAAYLGKILVRDYLRGMLGEPLRAAVSGKLETEGDILTSVYLQPHPQRFLGSLASVLDPDSTNLEIRALVAAGMEAYFEAFASHLEEGQSIHFTGGVAYAHRNQLEEVASRRNIRISQVMKSPIEGLRRYHQ